MQIDWYPLLALLWIFRVTLINSEKICSWVRLSTKWDEVSNLHHSDAMRLSYCN